MRSRSFSGVTMALVIGALQVPAGQSQPDATYLQAVQRWRAQHEADYTREYVPLAGLFFLKRGANTVGSAAGSDVELPARAPASVGTIVYESPQVRFHPVPGSAVTLRGRRVTEPVVLRPAGGEPADELAVGDLAFWVHPSGERLAIRLRDPQGEIARTFAGFRWYPIDPQYRVSGRFIRDPAPREIRVASLTGDDQTYTTEGMVEFALGGQTFRMRPMTTGPGRFFFIMRDATSGRETYEAARFLYADLLPDGTTVLDFNQAYNPPCAFNPYTTCPLPPPENRLTTPLRAGELDYVKRP